MGPGSRPGHEREDLRCRADHLRDLFDDLADLVLGDDQGRGQAQRVAGHPHHQIIVVEGAVEPGEAALAWRKQIDQRWTEQWKPRITDPFILAKPINLDESLASFTAISAGECRFLKLIVMPPCAILAYGYSHLTSAA